MLTPNMSLPEPSVGTTPGPDWATDINNCLTIIDSHSHIPGEGVAITPAAMNINADLPMGNNNLLTIKSLRFTAQGSPLVGASDLGCLYESGVDLYYNDGAGNQVRITQSGGVAGTPGSISNLLSPASASYVAGSTKFVWQSDTNTSADMDFGSAILRNATANSKGLTLAPPSAMGADFTITLPALPASTKILRMSSSGGISASLDADNSSLEISANVLQIKDSGVTTAKLSAGAVTRAKIAALGQQQSSSSGSYTTTSASYQDITNCTVSITTSGRPVQVCIQPSPTQDGFIGITGGTPQTVTLRLLRDLVVVYECEMFATSLSMPPGCLNAIDVVAAGTYQYILQMKVSGGSTGVGRNLCMIAYEIG